MVAGDHEDANPGLPATAHGRRYRRPNGVADPDKAQGAQTLGVPCGCFGRAVRNHQDPQTPRAETLGVFQQSLPALVIQRLIAAATAHEGAARTEYFGRTFEREAVADDRGMIGLLRVKRCLKTAGLG
jgi:hypothetical protein